MSNELLSRVLAGIEVRGGPTKSPPRMRVSARVARLVLIRLADRANSDGLAWPAAESLAHDLGIGVRTVKYAFDALEEQELIFAERGRSGGHRPTYWTVLPGPLTVQQSARLNGHEPCSTLQATVQQSAPQPCSNLHTNLQEPPRPHRGVGVGGGVVAFGTTPTPGGNGQPQGDDPKTILGKIREFVPSGEIVSDRKLLAAIAAALGDGQPADVIVKAATNPKLPPGGVRNWTAFLVARIKATHGTVAGTPPTVGDWNDTFATFDDLVAARWNEEGDGYEAAHSELNAALDKAIHIPLKGDREACDLAPEWTDAQRIKALGILEEFTDQLERGMFVTWQPRPICAVCEERVDRVDAHNGRQICRDCTREAIAEAKRAEAEKVKAEKKLADEKAAAAKKAAEEMAAATRAARGDLL